MSHLFGYIHQCNLHKKGALGIAKNYRGLSESLGTNMLTNFSDSQFGFRRYSFTTVAIALYQDQYQQL